MSAIKKSYGILCCRPSTHGTEILMVKRSTTYHFCEFISGHYRKQNNQQLINLFNNMTSHEKMDILSMKFSNMWYRIYREHVDESTFAFTSKWASSYFKKKSKFESSFLYDSGVRLKSLIESSTNVDTPWEFPKGRKMNLDEQKQDQKQDQKQENDVNAAIREFQEETEQDESKFTLLLHIKPYVETYTDFGITYQNIYFYALANGKWDPIYKFGSKTQVSEIADIKWVSLNKLSFLNLEPLTYRRLIKSFRAIIKKYKNSKKIKS